MVDHLHHFLGSIFYKQTIIFDAALQYDETTDSFLSCYLKLFLQPYQESSPKLY